MILDCYQREIEALRCYIDGIETAAAAWQSLVFDLCQATKEVS